VSSRPRRSSTRPAAAHPPAQRSADSRTTDREQVTIADLCAELKISRSTFYDWRAKGRAPECMRLPNGDIRILRSDLDAWLQSCRETA
jgi:predicted DNA-binding transcriptional regulator AlpA